MNRRQTQRLIVSHGLSAVAMSMPWPALLASTWASTHSEAWLGGVGAARMAPYVLLSWAAGGLGDRVSRLRVVQVSTLGRVVLLAVTAGLVSSSHIGAAVVVATLVVAIGTPAYPTLAAAMPATAGSDSETATSWLVTLEVSTFVVGPAVGGLILGLVGGVTAISLAALVAATASLLLVRTHLERPAAAVAPSPRRSVGILLHNRAAVQAIIAVSLVNGVVGAIGVALLPLSELSWSAGDREFGFTTSALGFGALATPLVQRALRLSPTAVRASLGLVAVPLAGVAASPAWMWAVGPLALLGATATQVECAATAVIQKSVPGHARAFALGFTDSAMVSVALIGAAGAPWLAGSLGPRGAVVVLLALVVSALAARSPHADPVRVTAVS